VDVTDIRVGTDIISIKRIESLVDKLGDKFLDRFLSKEEIDLIKRVETIAGFWAAKEAISKALGVGIGKDLAFKDILIFKDKRGRPHFKVKKERFKIISSSLSISHDSDFAIATAIVVCRDN
jgi:holo-[acyl-carrier protein] synthase